MKDLKSRYTALANKLGKLPTRKECRKLLGVFIDDFGAFKSEVLKKNPELAELEQPKELSDEDIESYRLSVYKSTDKKSINKTIQKVSGLQFIEEFSRHCFSGKIKNRTKKPVNFQSERTHTLVLSDLHIGSDIESFETGVSNYGKVEESRRLGYVIKEAINYKTQYRNETHLEVLLLGDIFEGQLHDPRTGAVMAEQFARSIHLLSQGLGHLAENYPTVAVRCATGNHGRNTMRHKERAVHGKYDSIDTMLYTALKYACSNLKNVKFHIPKTPLAAYEVYGKRIAYTHGDTVIKTGNPGASVNIRNLETQINKINASLPNSEEYSVLIHGHTHQPYMVHLSNGCVIIGNGSLPSPDSFAVSIGLFESHTGQYIFESTPGFPVGDVRLIRVNKSVDKDKSLDKFLKPWKEF